MILTEKIPESALESLNKTLIDHYGKSMLGRPNLRVIWSDDQFEKRVTDYTDSGLKLLHPEVRELPKYRQSHPQRYILERLVLIPEGAITDLVENFSYEPLWTFESKERIPLIPTWPACRTILDALFAQIEHPRYKKYVDEEDDPKIAKEVQEARIDKIFKELSEDESKITDALSVGEGIVVPGSYES